MTKPKLVKLDSRANAETIAMLEELLEMAKSGEIYEGVCIMEGPTGYLTRWTSTQDSIKRLGAVTRLQHRLQLKLDEGV